MIIAEGTSKSRKPMFRYLAVAAAGAVAALVFVQLVPALRHTLGPATVNTRGNFGTGETTVVVPPLGTIKANTHKSPWGLTLSVAEIDPGPLADAVSLFSARDQIAQRIEDDLRRTVILTALRFLLGSVLIGAIAAGLLPHRTFKTIASGAAGGALACIVVVALTAFTFRIEAFSEPEFTGALERAPQVIEAVEGGLQSIDDIRSSYERLAGRLAELLTLAAGADQSPAVDSVPILHVSDIHSNPIGVQITKDLAERFSVAAILDTGDLTSFGQPLEARIGDLIAEIDLPYIFVPGNHDSSANRRQLARVPNVELLDGESIDVRGVSIFGVADPTFTATNEVSTEEANELKLERASDVAEAVAVAMPDILAVHDVRQASESLGLVPLVLAGHTHRRAIEVERGTLLMTVGSTGATGLGSFLVEADLEYEAEVVYLRDGRIVAYDYISFDGLGGDFTVQRRTIDEPEPLDPPSPTPAASATP